MTVGELIEALSKHAPFAYKVAKFDPASGQYEEIEGFHVWGDGVVEFTAENEPIHRVEETNDPPR